MTNNQIILAIPTSDRQNVDGHFGHAREFAFYTIVNNQIVDQNFIVPPKHEPGVLPRFLAEKGASTIITGGMGAMAVNLFNGNDIDVILGATGSLDAVVEEYVNGTLLSRGSVCSHDHNDHHAGGHHS